MYGKAKWTITKDVIHACGCKETIVYSAWMDTTEERLMLGMLERGVCEQCQIRKNNK